MKHEKGEAKNTRKMDLGAINQTAGNMDASGIKVGIVVSRFNESLTSELLKNAVTCLRKYGADDENIQVYWVPGAYEIPAVIHRLAETHRFDALIALGLVIQGETPHAEMINHQVAHFLAATARECHVPVIHEVVATHNIEQAVARCTSGENSRGWYAACAAVEMAVLYREMEANHV